MKAGLYQGDVEHKRFLPVAHSFSYGVSYYFINLQKIDEVFNSSFLFTHNSPGLVSFWDKDYLTDKQIKDYVLKESKQKVDQVYILTNPSYFGFCFNPVSFYYCYDQEDHLIYVLSHITNTPWGEKHLQLFKIKEGVQNRFEFQKDFHVSPFMPMEMKYTWIFENPTEKLTVYMQNRMQGENKLFFDSNLKLERLEMSLRNQLLTFAKFPLITFKTIAAIYYQAARLYIKNVPFYTHPSKREAT